MSERAVWVPKVIRGRSKVKGTRLTDEQVVALRAARRAKAAEQTRRSMEARRRAHSLLADAHPEEFAALMADMVAQITDERGPLPKVTL